MIHENSTGNKRISKDINKMLPPHLRAKGVKNSKYSSPLKNQVEPKEDKASLLNSDIIQNENLNPNVNAVNEIMISRSKSTNEAIDQSQRKNLYNEMISDIKKSNSYNSGNYKVQPVKSNYTSISRSDSLKNFVNNNTNKKDALIINTKRTELYNSTAPFSATTTGTVTTKAAKRRSSSLPTSPLDMFNTSRVRMGNFAVIESKSSLPKESYLERQVSISRSVSRSGSDDKIQQILGDGAVDSFERNNSQQLNESITNKGNKGNREKIQQILIEGNNKNKVPNKEVASVSSNSSSSTNGNTNKNAANAIAKKPMNLNELTAVTPKETKVPSSILLNGNRNNIGDIERSGSSKSVSIIDKNGHIRNLSGEESPRLSQNKMNESQLSFALPLSQGSAHIKANSLSSNSSSDDQFKNPVFPAASMKMNAPLSNIITPMAASLQQGPVPRPFNNDEAMAVAKRSPNSYGFVDRNSKNDIFSYGRKIREEESRKRSEKKNTLKISRETLVFSCFIEKLSSRRKFQKRILRFDGIFLTCLSPKKKQRLPANTTFTMVNPPCFADNSEDGKIYLDVLKKLYSNLSPGPEFSGPLIAIEDSKSKNGNSNPNLKAKYLYIPKWIINIKDIISVRPLIHPDLLSFSNSSQIYKNMEPELEHYTTGDLEKDKKTFIIITRDNVFYVIRTYTEREFNRWLYILTRTKEILEELVDPRLVVPEVLPPPPSTSPEPTKLLNVHGNMNRNSMMNFDAFNKGSHNSSKTSNNSSNIGSTDSDASNDIRRFMAREDDRSPIDIVNSGHRRSHSRTSHHSGSIGRSGSALSNTNVDLMSMYTNKTSTVQLKTEYTDLIDRNLPKDPLHLHYTICDHWKGVLEQLYAIDKDIYSSVTRAENSELMSILRENGELEEEQPKEKDGSDKDEKSSLNDPIHPTITIPNSNSQPDLQSPSGSHGGESHSSSESGRIPSQFKDKPLMNAIPPTSVPETEQPVTRLRPRPRSGSAPPLSVLKSKYEPEDNGIKSAGVEGSGNIFSLSQPTEQSRRKDLVSMAAVGPVSLDSKTNTSIFTNTDEDNLIHSQVYTIDTIEQPQLMTMKKTSDNRPMKQHRSSIYHPNTTESIRIPSHDPTLKQPLIQSIPWDGDLKFAIMGLLRIFHRLSGIPFEEDGETESNTPPPPIPRWYYQFCVKSIPVYIIQVQNMMIDYLQELEYQQSKQDEIELIKDEIRQRNKSLLSERYTIVQGALDSFIKLSSLWDDIMSQWKLEMIRDKFNGDTLPINENEMDTFLLQHVQVNDVLNVHSKIRDYLGKEILIGCRNLLKLFEKEE